MSRTRSTAPLRVQAWTLPAWSTVDRHSGGCVDGTGPCTLSRDVDVTRAVPGRHDRCTRTVRYYRGCHGGVRRNQSSYASMREASARVEARAQLRAAVKAANATGAGGRFDDGTMEDHWDLDVHARPHSIERLLW